jgi:hypothetical protein
MQLELCWVLKRGPHIELYLGNWRFWGNSLHSIKILRIQKNAITITLGCKKRTSCRNLFRKLEILSLASQYILSLMLFVVKNKNECIVNSDL